MLDEFARTHWFCQACGATEYGAHNLTTHHIIGGRGGRANLQCNLLRLGWHPCHQLAEKESIQGPDGYLPKIGLDVAIAMKLRAEELSAEDMEVLRRLHGRSLPEPYMPKFFADTYNRNRSDHASRNPA